MKYSYPDIEMLKQLALDGAMYDYTVQSTTELSKKMGISQQSASNRLLKLLNEGLIVRNISGRKQRVMLTPRAINLLRKEFSIYKRIFEAPQNIEIKGFVTPGLGEGQYYINLKNYREQFRQKFEFIPRFGTLNLRLTGIELIKLETLKQSEGMKVHGFQTEGRTFGDVKCFHCTIGKIKCGLILPARSHHSDMVEIISNHNLRRIFRLADGDLVKLSVQLSPT